MRNTLKRVQSTNIEMFKPTSGRKQENGVWKYFDFDASTDKSRCKVEGCVGAIKGKNATNLVNHLKSKHKDIPSSAAEEKTNQPPLKRFKLLAQDMSARSSAAAVTAANTVDNELIAYTADSKTYAQNTGLEFWIANENKFPLLAPLAQDLLSAPASEAYVERVFLVCGDMTTVRETG
jgi:hypothetical protein